MLYFVYNKEVNMKKIGMIFILFLGIIVSSSLLASCGEETVPVEDISMPENVELFKGQSKVIDVDFTPQNAYNYYINFESSDNQIVEITNSSFNKVRVYAKNYGNATITCIVKNIEGSEEITAETNISVTDGEMFDIAIDSDQLDLLYYEGQTLNLSDIKVYACYQSGNRVLLQENEYEINIPNPLTIGSVVRVQYGVYQDEIMLNVIEDILLGIELTNSPTKTQYLVGESFNSEGMIIESVWASGKREIVEDFTYDSTPFKHDDSVVRINYQNFSVEIPISVRATYQVYDYSQLQNIINMAQDGDSIMIIGQHSNVDTVYIPASKNLYIYGEVGETVSITAKEDSPAFIITGDSGSLTLANLTIISQGTAESSIVFENVDSEINLVLQDVIQE